MVIANGGTVPVGVGVDVDVRVGVAVGVSVRVGVAVSVGVGVLVRVGVDVKVAVLVTVAVRVGVAVDVTVAVGVGVTVDVWVNVGVAVLGRSGGRRRRRCRLDAAALPAAVAVVAVAVVAILVRLDGAVAACARPAFEAQDVGVPAATALRHAHAQLFASARYAVAQTDAQGHLDREGLAAEIGVVFALPGRNGCRSRTMVMPKSSWTRVSSASRFATSASSLRRFGLGLRTLKVVMSPVTQAGSRGSSLLTQSPTGVEGAARVVDVVVGVAEGSRPRSKPACAPAGRRHRSGVAE